MTIYFIVAAGTLLAVVGAAIKALSNRATIKGMTGERLVRAALGRGLDPGVYRIINDVTVPSRDGTTQIDHVVLSRFGIFTLETKHLSGWIFAKAGGRLWVQTSGKNRKVRFQNPLRQNHAHVKALEAVTGLGADAFVPLVVMTGSAQFKTGMPQGVVGLDGLIDWIRQATRVRLSGRQIDAAQAAIEAARLAPGVETNQAHVAGLRRRFGSSAGSIVNRALKSRRQTLGALRVVALVLMGAVAWSSLDLFNNAVQESLQTITQGAEPTPQTSTVQVPGKPGAQPAPARTASASADSSAGSSVSSSPGSSPSSSPGSSANSPPGSSASSSSGSSMGAPTLAIEPLTQGPEPQITIEPNPPVTRPGKLGTVPQRWLEERTFTTAEQRRQFEEALDCEITGTFRDCSCYTEAGAKVVMGNKRCKTLARQNGVRWIARPD